MKYVLTYSHFIPIFNKNSMKSWMMKLRFALSHDFLSVHHEYFVGTFASILLCPPTFKCLATLLRHVQDCGRRLRQTKYRMLAELSFVTCRDVKRQGRNRRVTRQTWLPACFIHRTRSHRSWRFCSAMVRKVPVFYWCSTIKMQNDVFIYILCLIFNYLYH